MNGVVLQVGISAGGVPNHSVNRGDITLNGITGDGWRHPQIHGIAKRAILLITSEGLDEIRAMGFPVYPGALGENLTTLGLDRRALRIGQRFRCGSATIQLTELRVPCSTLSVYGDDIQKSIFDARAMQGDASSEVWALGGFYASVIEGGTVAAGDTIALVA